MSMETRRIFPLNTFNTELFGLILIFLLVPHNTPEQVGDKKKGTDSGLVLPLGRSWYPYYCFEVWSGRVSQRSWSGVSPFMSLTLPLQSLKMSLNSFIIIPII